MTSKSSRKTRFPSTPKRITRNALHKDSLYLNGRTVLAKTGSDIFKINNEAYMNQGSPVHSKFTYNELAVLKYFGKHFHLENSIGYNGIVQRAPFTDTEPYSIEINRCISLNSHFGKRLETDIYIYRKNIKPRITGTNNKT